MNSRTASGKPSSPTQAAGHDAREGVKDTVESVIIAFILAFVFRAFLVEAFVIPTGSMAVTLYGKHGTITCADCGWEFAYGLTDQTTRVIDPESGTAVQKSTISICANCHHENTNLKITDMPLRRGNAEPGDRILVFKWPFDLGQDRIGPQRWDVAVFKDPSAPATRLPASVPQNFIKRLVGLPNEVLEIIDGDVYSAPVSELSAQTMATLDALRHVKYIRRGGERTPASAEHERLANHGSRAVLEELNKKLRICRKTRRAQESLWGIVYDHDYPPQNLDASKQPHWAVGREFESRWDTSDRRIRCDSRGVDGGFVKFSGKPIDNYCAYNISPNPFRPKVYEPVSDLKLDFVLVPQEGAGYLGLTLSKYEDVFEARVWADGLVELYHSIRRNPKERDQPICSNRLSPFAPGQPVEVCFQVVDYRVSLSVNDAEVLATTDDQYAPDIRALRKLAPGGRPRPSTAPPRISARDMVCEMWHVALHRDVYYTAVGREQGILAGGRTGWGTTGNPIWLREGEHFMLGDNSPASKDSRLWERPGHHVLERGEDYQLGTVPRDQLIGRAFFVYWPSGHRSDLIPFPRDWGLIPNFGRMRWIR